MKLAILLTTLLPILVQAGYSVIQRPQIRQLQEPTAEPSLVAISFDGDLDRIVQMALEKAERESSAQQSDAPSMLLSDAPSLVPSAEPSPQPVTASPTAAPTTAAPVTDTPTLSPVFSPNTCPDEPMRRLFTYQWKYTIETVARADPDSVMAEVEENLQEKLAPLLLSCLNAEVANASIVALDSTWPRDATDPDAVCAPDENPLHVCTVVDGTVRTFLSSAEDDSEARALLSNAIDQVIDDEDFVASVDAGLIRIQRIQDTIIPPATEGEREVEGNPGIDGNFSYLILGVASASVVALVGTFYYWKRGGDDSGDATLAAGLSIMNESDISSHVHHAPASPFSEMLPSAYRFSENMSILTEKGGMSPVIELSHDEQSQDTSEDMLSDSSPAPDNASLLSFDLPPPRSIYPEISPVLLGARKRAGGETTAGMHEESESDLDSSMESSQTGNTAVNASVEGLLGQGLLLDDDSAEQSLLFADVEQQSVLNDDAEAQLGPVKDAQGVLREVRTGEESV